jgi:hypothetical protein
VCSNGIAAAINRDHIARFVGHDMIDTPPMIEVRFSSSKLWRLASLTAIPAIGCSLLAFAPYTSSRNGVGVMVFGAIFCAARSAYFAYLAIMKSGQTAFTVGTDGILDKRVSNEIIPWKSIEAISTWRDPSLPEGSENDDRVVLLTLKPEDAARLQITQAARLARAVDSEVTGSDGFQIKTGGTDVDYSRLLKVSESYLELAKLAAR